MGRETQWGIEKSINILAPLNTSGVLNQIYPIESGGPSIYNNGIPRDGGVTELYEYGFELDGPETAIACRNGRLVGLDKSGNIYIGDQSSVKLVGKASEYTFSRLAVEGYIDAIPTSTAPSVANPGGTLAALRFATPAESLNGGLVVDELDALTLTVLDSVLVSSTLYVSARLARANDIEFLYYMTADDTGVIAWDYSDDLYWLKNGTDYLVEAGISKNNQFQAFFSPVAAHLGVGITACGSKITYSSIDLVWGTEATHAVAFGGTLGTLTAHGLTMGSLDSLSAATATLRLGVAADCAYIPNFVINVSAAGAVTVTGGYAEGLYAGAASEATFQMLTQSGVTGVPGGPDGAVTPLGSSGLWGTVDNTHAHPGAPQDPYGTFGFGNVSGVWGATSATNSVTTPCRQPPDGCFLVGTLSNGVTLVARTYLCTVSLLAAGRSATDPPTLVNDFGGGSYQSDIPSGCGVEAKVNSGFFIPPACNSDTLCATYLTNSGVPVVVNFSDTDAADYIYNEIAPGVVALNTVGAVNSIIDGNTGALYENCGAFINSFHMDLATVSDVSNFKTFNIYSSQIDPGLVYSTSDPANIVYFDDSLSNQTSGLACYGSVIGTGTSYTGTYLGDIVGTVLQRNAAHAGVYSFNQNVPVAADADFTGPGIITLFSSAVQTQDYFGYALYTGSTSNLLRTKMRAIWLLHGSLYAFDGDAIYYIPLSGGSVGVVQGAPVKTAFATGLSYLCASPTRAFFAGSYDNSLYSFDGGRTVTKIAFFNGMQAIADAVYSVPESTLVMRTSDNGITGVIVTMRDDEQTQEVFSTVPRTATTNLIGFPGTMYGPPFFPSIVLYPSTTLYPASSWTLPEFKMYPTSDGVFYINGAEVYTRTYHHNSGSLIPLNYQSANLGLGENQTMQIGRISVQLCALEWLVSSYTAASDIDIGMTWSAMDPSGEMAFDSVTLTVTCNLAGLGWATWTPQHSNVLAGSLAISTGDASKKLVLLEVLVYYMPGPEMIPPLANRV